MGIMCTKSTAAVTVSCTSFFWSSAFLSTPFPNSGSAPVTYYLCWVNSAFHCTNLLYISTQFALTIASLLILVITSRVRPYTDKWVNFVEVLILLNLVLLSAYFLDNKRLPSTANNDFAVVLLIIPFIYFSLYLLTKIITRCWYVSLNRL